MFRELAAATKPIPVKHRPASQVRRHEIAPLLLCGVCRPCVQTLRKCGGLKHEWMSCELSAATQAVVVAGHAARLAGKELGYCYAASVVHVSERHDGGE